VGSHQTLNVLTDIYKPSSKPVGSELNFQTTLSLGLLMAYESQSNYCRGLHVHVDPEPTTVFMQIKRKIQFSGSNLAQGQTN